MVIGHTQVFFFLADAVNEVSFIHTYVSMFILFVEVKQFPVIFIKLALFYILYNDLGHLIIFMKYLGSKHILNTYPLVII